MGACVEVEGWLCPDKGMIRHVNTFALMKVLM